MSANIIPPTRAETQYEQLCDSEGRLILLPSAMVALFRAMGMASLTVTVSLGAAESVEPWLTLTQAAQRHLDDVDGMTFSKARMRITRACASGAIVSRAERSARRIDPTSFAAWRLKAREGNLHEGIE